MNDTQFRTLMVNLQCGMEQMAGAASAALSPHIAGQFSGIANGIKMNLDLIDSQNKQACVEGRGPNAERLRKDADIRMRGEALLRNDNTVNDYVEHTEKIITVLSPRRYEKDEFRVLKMVSPFYSFNNRVDRRYHWYVSWHSKEYHKDGFKDKTVPQDVPINNCYRTTPRDGAVLTLLGDQKFNFTERQYGGSEIDAEFSMNSSGPSVSLEVKKDALEDTNYTGYSVHFNYPWFLNNFPPAMLQFGYLPDASSSTKEEFIAEIVKAHADRPTPEWLDALFAKRNSYYGFRDCIYTEFLADGKTHWKYRVTGSQQTNMTIYFEGVNDQITEVTFDQKSMTVVGSDLELERLDSNIPGVYLTPSTWAVLKDGLVAARNDYLDDMALKQHDSTIK